MQKTYCYRCGRPVKLDKRVYRCTCGFSAYVYVITLYDFAQAAIPIRFDASRKPAIRWYGGQPIEFAHPHALEKIK